MNAFAALVLIGVAAVSTAALPAETAPPDTVTWSVAPATSDGEDGRSWIERDVDPGDTFTEHLAVTNFSDEDVTFLLSAADGYVTENGRFNMLQSNEPSVAAGTWIAVQESVTVPAEGMVVVPFRVAVPADATPGDNAAGVAASVLTQTSADGGAAVGVESRVGFRVMMRVSGELSPSLEISGLSGDYSMEWNPFLPGRATMTFTLRNTGNARLDVVPAATVTGHAGHAASGTGHELLPGDERLVTVPVTDVWPLLFGQSTVDAVATVPGANGAEVSATASTMIWTPPISQLLVVAGLGLLLGAVVVGRRRHQAQLDSLLANARAEGARAAQTDTLGR